MNTPSNATISFYHQGQHITLENPDPTMTTLDWLRETQGATGSKEGCAEGDCGACTAVTATLHDGALHYETINTCIAFLPMLEGKALITVEDLQNGDQLHPAQQAMVETHGSQCGFCTPGFVASLFALHRTTPQPNRQEIDDALAGNLCRCTGYGPIIEAAETMSSYADNGAVDAETLKAALTTLQNETSLAGDAANTKWFSPTTADELAALYAAHPDATIISGATDVGLWVTKHHATFEEMIFMNRVTDLQTITKSPEGITIGAGVSYTDAHAALSAMAPDFGELVRRIGSRQVRNAGTIGGNVANGSPIGDTPPAMIALGTTVTLRQGQTRRTVQLEEFFIDYGKQDRQPGEFVESLFIPTPAANTHFKAFKLSKRFDQDITAVLGCFAITIEGDTITQARIAYGGMAGTPKRATLTEQALTGQPLSPETFEAASQKISEDFSPLTDMRGSADYRTLAATNLVKKCGVELLQPDTATRLVGLDAERWEAAQ